MNFVSYAQLAKDVTDWCSRLPRDIDAVIGVPRSGIIPASMIALQRNIPILYSGLESGTSNRCSKRLLERVLVVDDSLDSGKSMERMKSWIHARYSGSTIRFEYAAVYPSHESRVTKVDRWYRVVQGPRAFEWNLFHAGNMATACLDMDGILCLDPPPAAIADDAKYEAWLPNATPFHLPTVPIYAIVTARLERYRTATAEWLRQHGVKFTQLIMAPFERKAELWAAGHGTWKGGIYRELDAAKLFVESSRPQAKEIKRLAGKPVICLEGMEAVA
ncbi:MAG: hypothetical protein A3E01_02805 [Gammaproteobacteria bacterium RIFCSPHIGHO2_12_FULL_63_22]|nr:MAG: hypothetical protein A3E01_02805 [Gammaproteobacteria bacterium RIFCSPHIGHO2_12_FULL_63_22]